MESEFLRLKDVARLTGFAQSTLRRWITVGCCPPFRKTPTGILLFKQSDVEAWLDSFEPRPTSDSASMEGATNDHTS